MLMILGIWTVEKCLLLEISVGQGVLGGQDWFLLQWELQV